MAPIKTILTLTSETLIIEAPEEKKIEKVKGKKDKVISLKLFNFLKFTNFELRTPNYFTNFAVGSKLWPSLIKKPSTRSWKPLA